MTDNFPHFARLVATDFQLITKRPNVFVTTVDVDALYSKYLSSFPEGTNPLFNNRTEHDCSCCKQFIRRAGNVVAVSDSGSLITIWDTAAQKALHPYNTVAAEMRKEVLSAGISDLYRVGLKETSFGIQQSQSFDKDTSKIRTWNHFYTGHLPGHLMVESPGAVCGAYKTTVQVFTRGLEELTPESIETVLSLIDSNNLYRGEEFRPAIIEFQKTQKAYFKKVAKARQIFAWTHADSPAARLRNISIGKLLQDLSEGMDVEVAVRSFEAIVAPGNYKRTTAVITPMMIKKAMETISSLGLESALERRFATLSDISVNDVLWVNRSARNLMKGGLTDLLLQHAMNATPKIASEEESRAEDISLDDFMKKILPEATEMEILFKAEHLGNLVSLTAPVHTNVKQLFLWDNNFGWSYGGNVTDSIKERVKKAGGRVDGAMLRVSLSWFNYDDLDLHIHQPPGRGVSGLSDHIYYGSKRGWTGGVLDVDMNAGTGRTREPVENIVWAQKMPDGVYKVEVKNFTQRETKDVGFVVEIENGGKLSHYSYNKTVRGQQIIPVVTLHIRNGVVERFEVGDPGITASNVSKEKWGLRTEQYVKVNTVTLSPNYWGSNAVGNKHIFFFIEGAKNDEPTRGIYNEFLHSSLQPHRKVLEIIGDKTKCEPTDSQLSGLGFSSTKHDSFVIKVQLGKKRRVLNVKIGA